MKISVISPESAAGRTFVSLGLFHAATGRSGYRVQLMGYDIDKPDLIRYFPELKFEALEVFASFPKIDRTHCRFCGACIHFCRTGALKLERNIPLMLVDPEKCEACGECIDACSIRGISTRERLTGYLLHGRHNGHVITIGRGEDAHDYTLPLICALNQHRMPDSMAICDLAPGFSGKVSLALRDTDLAVIVVKSDELWENQLEEIIAALKDTGISYAAILNFMDEKNEWTEAISRYMLQHDIPVLGMIPSFVKSEMKNINEFHYTESGMAAIFADILESIMHTFPEKFKSLSFS